MTSSTDDGKSAADSRLRLIDTLASADGQDWPYFFNSPGQQQIGETMYGAQADALLGSSWLADRDARLVAAEAALADANAAHQTSLAKCACARCDSGLPHSPTIEESQTLQAQVWALEAALSEHDAARAKLSLEHETRRLAEWKQASEHISALEAERERVTALGAQWAQEREDAREQLGREMATVDDMVKDVARVEAQLADANKRIEEMTADQPAIRDERTRIADLLDAVGDEMPR